MDDNSQTEILGSQHIAPDGPFKLEMQVLFKVIDGENAGYDAWASVDLSPGTVPTAKHISERIAAVQDQLGPNYQLASRHQFVNDVLCTSAGVDMDFAIPGPDTFSMTDDIV